MIKSINVWAFKPDRSLASMFAIAREMGFEGVEVSVAEGGELSPDATESDCARVRDAAQDAGVQITGLASGLGWKYPLTAPDAGIRRQGIEATAKSLRIASWLGVDAILVVPGGVAAEFIPGFHGASYDVAYDNAMASLRELRPVAEETGVTLAIENVWNKFLLSPLEMRTFLDEVGGQRVGSYFDVGNVILTGLPEQWIRILGKRIARVHFKDFKRSVGTLDGFCPLLEGDVDYPAVIAALRDIGYDGPVAAEFFDCEDQLPAISAAMDKILGRG